MVGALVPLSIAAPALAAEKSTAASGAASTASLGGAAGMDAAPAGATASAAPAPGTSDDLERPSTSHWGAPQTGFEWSLRLGFEVPVGSADGGSTQGDVYDVRGAGAMSEAVRFGVPLIVDLGYRTSPHVTWSIAGQAGMGWFGRGCDDTVRCAWSELRASLNARYSFTPGAASSPWLGLGAGWEWLRLWSTGNDPNGSLSGTRELLGGPQLALNAGWAFTVDDSVALGPYLSATAGMYLTSHFLCRGAAQCERNSSVEDKALHAWLSAGLSGSYGP